MATHAPAPGPRGSPLVGSLFELQRQGQFRFYLDNWRRYGDIVRFRAGPVVGHILAHPDAVQYVLVDHQQNYGRGLGYAKTRELLGDGLLTSEGDLWRGQRQLMEPALAAHALVAFAPEMTKPAEQTLKRWETLAARGEAIDLFHEMQQLCIRIIGRTILGTGDGQVSIESAMVQAYNEACVLINQRLAALFDLPLFIPTPFNRRFNRSIRDLDRLVAQLIQTRRNHPDGQASVLSQMLALRDPGTGAGMTDRQMRDHIITLFFAGHETTAEALTWAWYLLAENPDCEATLHAELAQVLGGRTPTVDDLARLPYTRQVVQETLRLYPPVWTFPRQAIRSDEIGGYEIPAGSLMLPAQYLTHRHRDFWENPETFEPGRFAPGRTMNRHPFAYYPFGGGARTCLGAGFVMQQVTLVLATLAQAYRLRRVSAEPIEPVSLITLRPSAPILMTIENS